jgi:hypothetical protein
VIRHSGETSDHGEGIEFPDIGAVQIEAIKSTGEILRDFDYPIEAGSEWRMEVVDEARKPLFSLRVIAELHELGRRSWRPNLLFTARSHVDCGLRITPCERPSPIFSTRNGFLRFFSILGGPPGRSLDILPALPLELGHLLDAVGMSQRCQ